MNTTYFTVGFLLVIFSISSYLYSKINDSTFYKKGKGVKIKSDSSFKAIYIWIKYSTLILTLSSILFREPQFLILFSNSICVLIGSLICILSVSLFTKATRDLGANYSPCYDSYKPNVLVTTGIYSVVRHPIYTSNIFLLFGISLISGNIIVFLNLTILIIFYYRASVFEENQFQKLFPNYKEYSRNTKRFIPGIL